MRRSMICLGVLVLSTGAVLVSAQESTVPDIHWFAAHGGDDRPTELEDDPEVVPVFEIETGWRCFPGRVERDGAAEARVVACEKGTDRFDVILGCGPEQTRDVQRLRFSDLARPRRPEPDDMLTVGCIVE